MQIGVLWNKVLEKIHLYVTDYKNFAENRFGYETEQNNLKVL